MRLVQYGSGSGGMNAEHLWETVVDPEHHILLRVTREEAVTTFEMLTGGGAPL